MASTESKPNLHWRRVVRADVNKHWLSKSASDEEFLDFALRAYAESKRDTEDATKPEQVRQASRIGAYVMAVALLTYGRLDVIEDIFANGLPPLNPALTLMQSIDALFPLPKGLSARDAPREAQEWIRAHAERLRWDEAEGRFTLS